MRRVAAGVRGKKYRYKAVSASLFVRFYSEGIGTNMVRLWYEPGTKEVRRGQDYVWEVICFD